MIAILLVLVILKDLFRDVDAFSRGFDAMTLATLAAAIIKLSSH
jgi:hypothetical protein